VQGVVQCLWRGRAWDAHSSGAATLLQRALSLNRPQHGSWLNAAEREVSVLSKQCHDRRFGENETLARETSQGERARNTKAVKLDSQFRTADARIKLRCL
jgi:hypothetical protein